jgi:hypothetical protein
MSPWRFAPPRLSAKLTSLLRRIVQSQALRLTLLVWFCTFFIIILPGHRRGFVAQPGYAVATPTDRASIQSTQVNCPLCVIFGKDDVSEQPFDPTAPSVAQFVT